MNQYPKPTDNPLAYYDKVGETYSEEQIINWIKQWAKNKENAKKSVEKTDDILHKLNYALQKAKLKKLKEKNVNKDKRP